MYMDIYYSRVFLEPNLRGVHINILGDVRVSHFHGTDENYVTNVTIQKVLKVGRGGRII